MRKQSRARFVRVPLVAPSAIKAYLERRLDDWRWMKEVPIAALRERVAEVVPDYTFHTAPRANQLVSFLLGREHERFLFNSDMGSGKTKIILDLIASRKGDVRALVCVPYNINMGTWVNQVKQHTPSLRILALEGAQAARKSLIQKQHLFCIDLCVINYAGLHVYMANRLAMNKKTGKSKRKIVAEDALDFMQLFNMVVFDEVHFLGNPKSLTYKCADLLSGNAEYAYGLTGTPFNSDPTALQPEFFLVDRGQTLGASLGMFHLGYFIPKKDFFMGVKWTFDAKKKEKLNMAIQHRSIRYEDTELKDLPALAHNTVSVLMTDAQRQRYKELTREMKRGEDALEKEAVFIRTRQTTSGFMVAGKDSERLEMAFTPNPKLDAIEQFLLDLDPKEKVVIFHDFVYSGVLLKRMLQKNKILYKGVGHGFKFPQEELRQFIAKDNVRVFLANARAGATGVDGLQDVARYVLFFESPVSPSLRKQAEKRVHRDGQTRHVYVYDFVVDNSVDTKILLNIARGADLFKAICTGKETL